MSGLFMLPTEVAVTVTREEDHQQHLTRYPVEGGQLVAELAWCTVPSGRHQGQRRIEVRLDGVRVGELTAAMSDRYAALVTEVTDRGHRPGCVAVLHEGKRGTEVTLRMPRADTVVVVPLAQPADSPQPSRPRRRKPVVIAAGVVGALLIIGAIASNEDEPAPTANGVTSTSTPATTTTTSVVASPPPPSPVVTTTVPTTQKPTTTRQTPTTTRAPEPPAEPQNALGCDPNYDPCVPIASDVDCAGGSGNGPAYVKGPVRVIGRDIYKLDNNGDGVGCEK